MVPLNAIKQTVREIIELGSKSAILADPKSKTFCKQYDDLKRALSSSKIKDESAPVTDNFLKILCKEHGLKNERLFNTISSLAQASKTSLDFEKNFTHINFEKLNKNLKPEYFELFQSLGRVKDGVQTLVKMREDLLNLLEKKNKELNFEHESDLKIMNSVLKSLLILWFSTGLLEIKRMDWNNSPAVLVEKIAHYESVHQIRTLSDLKNRLSSSRRCFIYTHSTMPNEPLVILHIALTNSISSNIKELIKTNIMEKNDAFNSSNATNAIFYSINSCQKGLQQVDLGNALIKSCVRLLLDEFPNLKNFHTLSPIPKFREWFDMKISTAADINSKNNLMENFLKENELAFFKQYFKTENDYEVFSKLKTYLSSPKYKSDLASESDPKTDFHKKVESFMKKACAYYLYNEKKNGFAFNSVANFHLRNGAQFYRVNFAADLSDNGIKSSYGLMVNYGYYLNDLDLNCVTYLTEKKIQVSTLFKELI